MKFLKRIVFFLYQWLVFVPIFLVLTILTALVVMIFAPIFGNKHWGYVPPKWWSKLTCWLALSPVRVRGQHNLLKNQSCVFVANHQGAFDIFMVYGFLEQNIKWVQKQSLRKIPFVGFASEIAGHVFVDNSSTAARLRTIQKAEKQLVDGVSVMIFPEGARTLSGKMGRFKRGAFQIAYDLKLPIVPLTINGPFDVMKRGTYQIHPRRMELVIHEPIFMNQVSDEQIHDVMKRVRQTIHDDLWTPYKDANE